MCVGDSWGGNSPNSQCHLCQGSPQKQSCRWRYWWPLRCLSWAVEPAGCWRRTRTSWSCEMPAARKVLPGLSQAVKAHVTKSHTLWGNQCLSQLKKIVSQLTHICRAGYTVWKLLAAKAPAQAAAQAAGSMCISLQNELCLNSHRDQPPFTNPRLLHWILQTPLGMPWAKFPWLPILLPKSTEYADHKPYPIEPTPDRTVHSALAAVVANPEPQQFTGRENSERKKMHFQHRHSPMPAWGPWLVFHQSSRQHQ